MRAFSVAGVIEANPDLKALHALAERLPSTTEQALAEVERIGGRGRLWEACSAPSRELASESSLVDDLIEGARSQRTDAARAIDAFVTAARSASGARSIPSNPVLAKIRATISDCVLATSLDALRSEPIATLEASWRGLRMLVERCRPQAGLRLDVLDVAPADAVAAVRDLPRNRDFDDPDALFIIDEISTIDTLVELAAVAEETNTPCVAAVSPRLLGAETADELSQRAEQGGPLTPAWVELRDSDASRWLCAAINRVVLQAEETGTTQRLVMGSPVWALATMLAASWNTQGSFAHVLGPAAAISAPAVWTPPARVRAVAIPIESFLPLSAQRDLARWGVLALGSERDSDRILLAAAPMVSSARGAYPLPAQLLAGRIVRYARWIREQVSPEMDASTVSALYEQGAGVFLFPGLSPAATMLKAAVSGEGAERTVHVTAAASPTHALVPLEMELSLKLERT